MSSSWLFANFACSGFAGLIYEVAWVRTLTLYMGHTTAATSTVVAAFMGGMASGSAIGGRAAARFAADRELVGYATLEALVIVMATALPAELEALTPVLRWAYRDGAPGGLFPAVRILTSLAVLMVPTMALGATFPFAVRWFNSGSRQRMAVSAGRLYAANTAGAALGTLGAGFLLIPLIGVTGATLIGVAASILSIAAVLMIAHSQRVEPEADASVPRIEEKTRETNDRHKRHKGHKGDEGHQAQHASLDKLPRRWLAGAVLASTGFATFLYEITWTRVFSTLIGPSTYAFAAAVTGLIAGLAMVTGSVLANACGAYLPLAWRSLPRPSPGWAPAPPAPALAIAGNSRSRPPGAKPRPSRN